MKPSFLADHFKSVSVPQGFQTMHLPHGQTLPGECFYYIHDTLMRMSMQISSHCVVPVEKTVSSAVLDYFLFCTTEMNVVVSFCKKKNLN